VRPRSGEFFPAGVGDDVAAKSEEPVSDNPAPPSADVFKKPRRVRFEVFIVDFRVTIRAAGWIFWRPLS
jgi:hypothetical protein